MTELDFYIFLFDEFLTANKDDYAKILWKLNSITKLMRVSDDSEFCENGLRMIMTLFKDYTLESFENDGTEFNRSSEEEREIVLPILKQEIMMT